MGKKRSRVNPAPPPRPGYLAVPVRAMLAVAWIVAQVLKLTTISSALAAMWPLYGDGAVPAGIERHASLWAERLMQGGSVLDAPHPGHRIVPDAVALEAANLLVQGHTVQLTLTGGRTITKHYWFHSIGDAIRRVPRLAAILLEYDIDKRHLLSRIHDVKPHLRYSKVHVKALLSAVQREARQVCANWFLARIAADPNFLNSVVWIDQVKVWLFGGQPGDIKVWHEAHGDGWDVVVNCCGGVNSKPIKLSLYAFVHATLGLVFFQFVTGTHKKIRAKLWPGYPGEERRADPDFTVRGVYGVYKG